MNAVPVADAIVFKCGAPAPAADRLAEAIAAAARGLPVAGIAVNLSLDGAEAYAYLWLSEATDVAPAPLALAVAAATGGAAVEAQRLACLQDVPGASHGAPVAFHYVLETDVAPEGERELNELYEREHLPGLAAVPGTVRALRFRNLDGAPRYHACYELAAREAFESPPWLAVRHTAWSDRVRPTFRNTKRAMFRRIAG